jgi:hypothetical protein
MSIPSYYRTKERVQMALKVHISTLSFYQLSSVSSSSFTGFTPNMFGAISSFKLSYGISIVVRGCNSPFPMIGIVAIFTPTHGVF